MSDDYTFDKMLTNLQGIADQMTEEAMTANASPRVIAAALDATIENLLWLIRGGVIVGPDQHLAVRCSPMTRPETMQKFRDDINRQYPDLSPRVMIIACEQLISIAPDPDLPIGGAS